MCDADGGILTYVWVKDHPMPFPDFSVEVFHSFHLDKRAHGAWTNMLS